MADTDGPPPTEEPKASEEEAKPPSDAEPKAEEKKEEKKPREGSREKSRDRDRRRSRSRGRDRDRDRDRRRRSPSPQGYVKFSDREKKSSKSSRSDRDRSRGRDRDRDRSRRRRRSPSDSSSDVDNFYKFGSMNVSGRGKAPVDQGPKKIWDGFQWVTQSAGVPQSALSGTGLSRKARRLHIGGLPEQLSTLVPNASQLLAQEIWNGFTTRGIPTAKPGENPVLSVWLSDEQNFAFVEFMTAEDANNALMLDGIAFMGQPLRVARPSDYTPANASVAVAQQLMMAQGMTDPALLAQIQQNMQQQITGGAAGVAPPAGVAAAPTPTTVLILTNLAGADPSEQDLDDILEDVQDESANHGTTTGSHIVKAANIAPFTAVRAETKIGDVYVSFGDTDSAFKCYSALHGRMFGGNQVVGIFMEPEKFAEIQSAM